MKSNKYISRLNFGKKVYSQFDEDGILEVLIENLINPNKTCVEIGWGSDILTKGRIVPFAENCTQNLVQNHGYKCYAFDGKRQNKIPNNVIFQKDRITPDSCEDLLKIFPKKVDVFSLDIDSFDFEVMEGLISRGFSPSIVCAEINRKFGYDAVCSMPYVEDCLDYTGKYWHGVSYRKYRNYFESLGYKFFTLCSSGVNIFFYDPKCVIEINLPKDILEYIHSDEDRLPRHNEEEIRKSCKEHEFWKDYEDDLFK